MRRMMLSWQMLPLALLAAVGDRTSTLAFMTPSVNPSPMHSIQPGILGTPDSNVAGRRKSTVFMSEGSSEKIPEPTTFREAEVLGLKFMQERKFEDALKAFQKGMKLPGSKSDVVRTKSLSGPSPVGGSMGGYESKNTLTLDEFELQAANYNMACAHSQLGNNVEAVNALRMAFENGFDNYATVRGDPDLEPLKGTKEFDKLMDEFEPKKGFNPFGLFGKK